MLTYRHVDAALQWSGTFLVLAGHMLTSASPHFWPYNIFCFFTGTILFLIWAVRVRIMAQIAVNAGSLVITGAGVVNGLLTFFK